LLLLLLLLNLEHGVFRHAFMKCSCARNYMSPR